MNTASTEHDFLSILADKHVKERKPIKLVQKVATKPSVNRYDQLPEYACQEPKPPTKKCGPSNSKLAESNKNTVELFCNEDGNDFKTLHRAVWQGKKKNVLKYLAKKEKLKKINKQDAHGRCVLHFAAASGKVDILKMLLAIDDIDKEIRDNKGMTPFYKAAQLGSIPCMKELQKHGAIIDTKDIGGNSPIHHIILYGDYKLDAVQHLLSINKSFIHTKNDLGMSPLHLAVIYGRIEIGRYLIENGAPLDEKNNKGLTPLMISASKDNKAMVEHLLRNGANVSITDNEQKTALDHAVKDSPVFGMLSDDTDTNKVDALCSREIDIMKQRDISMQKTEQLRTANKNLEEKIQQLREVRKKQKGSNIVNGIRKKSVRMLNKHKYDANKIKELTGEVEQDKEMKILENKITDLENNYEKVMVHYDIICAEDLDVRGRLAFVHEKMKKLEVSIASVKQELSLAGEDSNMASFEIKEAERELERKMKEITEVQIKIDECKKENESAKQNYEKEINELRIKLKESNSVLQKYKFGLLDDLENELKTAEENNIATTKKINNIKFFFKKLNKKYKALKETQVSGEQNSQ